MMKTNFQRRGAYNILKFPCERDKKDMFDLAEMIVKELNQKHAKMFPDYALQNCDYVKTSDLKLGDKNRFTMENKQI